MFHNITNPKIIINNNTINLGNIKLSSKVLVTGYILVWDCYELLSASSGDDAPINKERWFVLQVPVILSYCTPSECN